MSLFQKVPHNLFQHSIKHAISNSPLKSMLSLSYLFILFLNLLFNNEKNHSIVSLFGYYTFMTLLTRILLLIALFPRISRWIYHHMQNLKVILMIFFLGHPVVLTLTPTMASTKCCLPCVFQEAIQMIKGKPSKLTQTCIYILFLFLWPLYSEFSSLFLFQWRAVWRKTFTYRS